MLFSKDENTGQITATLLNDGNTEIWECLFCSCPNPVCTCSSIEIVLTPLNDETHPDQPGYERQVHIDLSKKMVGAESQSDMTPEDLELSNLFQSQLNDDDFEFMLGEHFDHKNEITETADPDSIDVEFDYEEVEIEGYLYGYNEILPYGDMMQVTLNNVDHVILDMYCLVPKCPCTDIMLQILPADEIAADVKDLFVLTLQYDKKHWKIEEAPPNPMQLNTLISEIENQNPGFYQMLKDRHKKLKKIYLSNRQKKYAVAQPVKTAKSVGRNDPCPCGSGKKYKKCCGKS